MVYVTLTSTTINSGTAVTVLCQQVAVALKKNKQAVPNANLGSIVEVQTTSIENPLYTLIGVHYALPASYNSVAGSTLTYPQVLTLWNQNNTPGSEVTMRVSHGKPGAEVNMPNWALTSTIIKGVITDATYPVDVTNSKGGYMPVGTISFTETL